MKPTIVMPTTRIDQAWNGNEEMRKMAPKRLPPDDIDRLRRLYRASMEDTLRRKMTIAAAPGAGERALILLGAKREAPRVTIITNWTVADSPFISGLFVTSTCHWARQGSTTAGHSVFQRGDSEHRFIKKISKRVRMGLGYALWNQQQLDRALQQLQQEQR